MCVSSLSLSQEPHPPGWLPPKLSVMKQAALWSHVCVIMEDPPPWLADPPPCLAWDVMGGWGARPLRWLSVLVLLLDTQLRVTFSPADTANFQAFTREKAAFNLQTGFVVCFISFLGDLHRSENQGCRRTFRWAFARRKTSWWDWREWVDWSSKYESCVFFASWLHCLFYLQTATTLHSFKKIEEKAMHNAT